MIHFNFQTNLHLLKINNYVLKKETQIKNNYRQISLIFMRHYLREKKTEKASLYDIKYFFKIYVHPKI